ncbi:hypothetical protein DY123_07580 [Apilactobacillus micheneri]|uniref:hypothetical protein n=1 Tax=Apilactobacillus micheneri TaxID=1899430 RepID=UPI0011283D3C|nr:hypothetical protein [Apilactobacillus micheneri]TPR41197.1 hypothetical protein DY123_07580 [Apilactobacillus micheneri]
MKKGGIGGANTNANGLKFEDKTDLASSINANLSSEYELKKHAFKNPNRLVIKNSKSPAFDVIRLKDNQRIGVITNQNQFYNVLYDHYGLRNANHKNWKPDEVFFNFETNTVYIVEKKWQSGAGSVDEKIFGFVNKRRLYQNNFNQLNDEPKPTVEFSALFNSDWWLKGGAKGENGKHYQDYFDNLRIDGIKIFFDKYEYWWFGL